MSQVDKDFNKKRDSLIQNGEQILSEHVLDFKSFVTMKMIDCSPASDNKIHPADACICGIDCSGIYMHLWIRPACYIFEYNSFHI